MLDSTMWPYGAIASINSTSPVVAGLGSNGCGACLQISCEDKVCLLSLSDQPSPICRL